MKIIAVDVFVTCPGRNFVTLKITTESGLRPPDAERRYHSLIALSQLR